MAAYNVVLVQPSGYRHSLALHDIGRLLMYSFQSLGQSCTFAINELDSSCVNVVLGYHLVEDPRPLDLCRCIIYQLEQLSGREEWLAASQWEMLRKAQAVWDYSPENVAFLEAQGVSRARLLPIGFHERLHTIVPAVPDIDVLFYGSVNERRRAVLAALNVRCNLKVLFGVYAEERDAYIARAKIVLNLHFYEAQLMEQARVAYLLNNRRFVISEESRHNPFAGGIVSAPYAELANCCLRHLDDAPERDRVAAAGYSLFQNSKMVDYLHAALEQRSD